LFIVYVKIKAITSCSVTEKFRKVNFLSHDRDCDDRIRHWNHLQSLIVLSTKVSPDLSPIEHLWDELGRRVRHRQNPLKPLQELWNALVHEWNNIQQAFIQLLIGSMRRRCKAVVPARGGHTLYWTPQTSILHDDFCLSMISCDNDVEKFCWYCLICYAHMNLNYTIFVDLLSLCKKYLASNPCIVSFVD